MVEMLFPEGVEKVVWRRWSVCCCWRWNWLLVLLLVLELVVGSVVGVGTGCWFCCWCWNWFCFSPPFSTMVEMLFPEVVVKVVQL
uniref:Transmembrane protein n=1 Tax=Meloidogyne incognita TaxID=6306 RepID=A0A914LAE7_MELIC